MAQPDPPDAVESSLSGQLIQDSGARVSSASGAALSGATVSVVSEGGVEVAPGRSTDSQGRFSFTGLPVGEQLIRVSFNGSSDLDGDGSRDEVEVLMPIDIAAGAAAVIVINIGGVDLNEDGELDGIDIGSDFSDDKGRIFRHLKRLLHRLHKLLIDEDGDGALLDDEPQDDENCDGIPDDISGHGNSLHGGVLRGRIEDIDEASITVEGVTFLLTEDTRWKDKGNKDPDHDVFSVGTSVLVKGRWDGEDWIAHEVKTSGPRNGGGKDDDDDDDDGDEDDVSATFHGVIERLNELGLSIEGQDFGIDTDTQWIIEGSGEVDPSLFDIGDFVMLEARQEGEGWIATRITLISDDDEPLVAFFSGEIEAITENEVTVDGQSIVLNAQTQFFNADGSEADPSLFVVGVAVKVEARREGTMWVANSVTLVEEGSGDPII